MRNYDIEKLKKDLYECESFKQVEDLVTDAIARNGDLVADNDAAEKHFAELGYEGKVKHNTIINQSISLCIEFDTEEEGIWTGAKVSVTEHYVDAGSDDYVYSYIID